MTGLQTAAKGGGGISRRGTDVDEKERKKKELRALSGELYGTWMREKKKGMRSITQPPLDRNNGAHKGVLGSPLRIDEAFACFLVVHRSLGRPPLIRSRIRDTHTHTHTRISVFFFAPRDVATRAKFSRGVLCLAKLADHVPGGGGEGAVNRE